MNKFFFTTLIATASFVALTAQAGLPCAEDAPTACPQATANTPAN